MALASHHPDAPGLALMVMNPSAHGPLRRIRQPHMSTGNGYRSKFGGIHSDHRIRLIAERDRSVANDASGCENPAARHSPSLIMTALWLPISSFLNTLPSRG